MKHYHVTISDDAKKDLLDIKSYIQTTLAAPQAALNTVKKIAAASMSLSIFPERGSIIEKLTKDKFIFRQLVVGNYRMIYRILEDSDEVLIIRIIYTARNIRL